MAISATLKFVLREPPTFSEKDGVLYTALTNEPKGVPANLALGETPVYLAVRKKAWTQRPLGVVYHRGPCGGS